MEKSKTYCVTDNYCSIMEMTDEMICIRVTNYVEDINPKRFKNKQEKETLRNNMIHNAKQSIAEFLVRNSSVSNLGDLL